MSVIITVDQTADLFRMAFDHVCDQSDWKGPIDCVVPQGMAELYMNAIEFMTGVRPHAIRYVGPDMADGVHLTCIGYRAGPCGG